MKRDMDLIRNIALELEAHNRAYFDNWSDLDAAKTVEKTVLSEHLDQMVKTGLIESRRKIPFGGWPPTHREIRLTPDGHDFLDAARDDDNWAQAKDRLASAGGFTIELMKAVLIDIARGQLG